MNNLLTIVICLLIIIQQQQIVGGPIVGGTCCAGCCRLQVGVQEVGICMVGPANGRDGFGGCLPTCLATSGEFPPSCRFCAAAFSALTP